LLTFGTSKTKEKEKNDQLLLMILIKNQILDMIDHSPCSALQCRGDGLETQILCLKYFVQRQTVACLL